MVNRIKYFGLAVCLSFMASGLSAAVVRTTLPEVGKILKTASPGDTVMVAAGTYTDLQLKWRAEGSAEAPVVVMAEQPGSVVISGTSTLKIYGRHLTVASFLFMDGKPVRSKGALVEFRNGDDLAEDCRMTDCVIDNYNAPRRDFPSSYVHLYGRRNRLDHCSFTGKKSLGVTVTVMLNYTECLDNHHSIDHNYFGYRPVYGSNGAETIRVGTSQQCMENSRTVISGNFFDRCNGEVEVISIKSCENVIKDNVLYECEGVLALRHGDRNLAEGNMFIGNGVRNTGGVRIVGEEQIVRGNTFYALAGSRFFSALALMNAVPNSLPNRYMQVKNCVIEENEFINCAAIEFGTGADYERTLAPADIVFRKNYIANKTLSAPYILLSDDSGLHFKDNIAVLADGAKLPKGFKSSRKQPRMVPCSGDFRSGKGASWKPVGGAAVTAIEKVVEVADESQLREAVANALAGTTVVLTSAEYGMTEGLKISVPMTIKAAEGVNPELRYMGRKSENFITVCNGGQLDIHGICFNGVLAPGRSIAKAGIATATEMIEDYNLTVVGCTFRNFGESGFVPIRGTAGTFAQKVEVRGCHFEALSGDGIYFAAELDDKGRYNADDVIIEDCTFERILGLPVNIYRGGSDESTAGPYVYVRGCRFNDCTNKVRGSVIRIIGAQILHIENCSFVDSGRGGYCVRLDEAPWEDVVLKGLTFRNSGGVLSNGTFEIQD